MKAPQFITNKKEKKLRVILSMEEYTRLIKAENELKNLKAGQKGKQQKTELAEATEARMKTQLLRRLVEE